MFFEAFQRKKKKSLNNFDLTKKKPRKKKQKWLKMGSWMFFEALQSSQKSLNNFDLTKKNQEKYKEFQKKDFNIIKNSFPYGCLGSRHDEERSKVR